jgi:hypothetical protein
MTMKVMTVVYLVGGDGFVLCGVWVGGLAVSKIDLGAHKKMGDVGHVVVHLRVPLREEEREAGVSESAASAMKSGG